MTQIKQLGLCFLLVMAVTLLTMFSISMNFSWLIVMMVVATTLIMNTMISIINKTKELEDKVNEKVCIRCWDK